MEPIKLSSKTLVYISSRRMTLVEPIPRKGLEGPPAGKAMRGARCWLDAPPRVGSPFSGERLAQ